MRPEPKPNLLIIEDNYVFAEYLRAQLDKYYNVTLCHDGESGIQVATNSKTPNIILTDIVLPDHDGVYVIKNLKKHPQTAFVPIVAMSSTEDDANISNALQSGANDYIIKPFKLEHLHYKLENLINITKSAQAVMAQTDFIATSFVERFEAVIQKKLFENASIKEIASMLSISVSSLERMCLKHYQMRPKQVILKKKLEHSKVLLRFPDANVKAVAYKMGFNSVAYFCKCFKQETDLTPGQYMRGEAEVTK